ncbi:MAG: leucyl aminopeptidase family protein [Actinobacteria bacterium]|nr:leucyl aminopeptidase family protein [Actinomycetota bacterium]
MLAPTLTNVDISQAHILALPTEQLAGQANLFKQISKEFEIAIDAEIKKSEHGGKVGEITELSVSSKKYPKLEKIYFVGIGKATPADFAKVGAALGRKARGSEKVLLSACASGSHGQQRHLISAGLANYSWHLKTGAAAKVKVPTIGVLGMSAEDLAGAKTILSSVWLTRDLIHTPANLKSPQWMAKQAKSALSRSEIEIKVHTGADLAKFGGLRAVGNSSPKRPPVMIELFYNKTKRKVPHVVLVGKGIMFDTGGVSLKRPYDTMVAMKSDMAGAAAIIGTMKAIAALGLNVRVTGLLICAENLLSATSQRPSDVITHYGGTTVEVRNTDAEGRLVLADGLAYANAKLKPDYLLDIATLTGSATLGLGRQHGAMYTRDQKLAKQLQEIGEKSGDRVWHMPLVDDYIPSLASPIADFNHLGDKPHVSGGSITAALFLEHFAGDSRWVHLDIAGTARSEVDAGENVKGGTGFGVRLLVEWISSL